MSKYQFILIALWVTMVLMAAKPDVCESQQPASVMGVAMAQNNDSTKVPLEVTLEFEDADNPQLPFDPPFWEYKTRGSELIGHLQNFKVRYPKISEGMVLPIFASVYQVANMGQNSIRFRRAEDPKSFMNVEDGKELVAVPIGGRAELGILFNCSVYFAKTELVRGEAIVHIYGGFAKENNTYRRNDILKTDGMSYRIAHVAPARDRFVGAVVLEGPAKAERRMPNDKLSIKAFAERVEICLSPQLFHEGKTAFSVGAYRSEVLRYWKQRVGRLVAFEDHVLFVSHYDDERVILRRVSNVELPPSCVPGERSKLIPFSVPILIGGEFIVVNDTTSDEMSPCVRIEMADSKVGRKWKCAKGDDVQIGENTYRIRRIVRRDDMTKIDGWIECQSVMRPGLRVD